MPFSRLYIKKYGTHSLLKSVYTYAVSSTVEKKSRENDLSPAWLKDRWHRLQNVMADDMLH